MTTQFDAYLRVSRVGARDVESERYQTERVQRQKITAWARSKGIEIANWELDRDVSGGSLAREGLDAIRRRIAAGQSAGIVVATLDRLSRAGVGPALAMIDELHEDGGQVVALDFPQIDPTDEMGEAFLTIFLALGRMERRRLARKWREAQEDAVGRGVHIGNAPYGFKRGPGGRLVHDPETWWIVQGVFDAAADGGVRAAQDYLAAGPELRVDDAVVLQADPINWPTSRVRRLLKNRAYIGSVIFDGIETKDAHEAITNEVTFAQAQPADAVLPHRAVATKYPLTGVAFCANCGGKLAGTRTGTNGRAMRCTANQRVGDGCELPAMARAERLTEYVVEQVAELLGAGQDDHDADAAYDLASRELEEAQFRLTEFALDTRARSMLGEADWLKAGEAYRRERDEAQEVAEAARLARSHGQVTGDEVRTAGTDELAGLLGRVGAKVVVTKGREPLAERVDVELGS